MEDTAECSYCGLQIAECLVKCVEKNCEKWFCNGGGKSEPGSGKGESHIIRHQKISHHRKIAVAVSKGGIGGVFEKQPGHGLFNFRCHFCQNDDSFTLGMEGAMDGRNPAKHFCREDALKRKLLGTWIPFVDCHNPSIKCINEKIVKVPPEKEQESCKKQITRQEIIELERSWLLTARGITLNTAQYLTIQMNFTSVLQYNELFHGLVDMERILEKSKCQAIPILEKIPQADISSTDTSSPLKWFTFRTKSQVHKNVFKRNQSIIVRIAGNTPIEEHQAVIKSRHEEYGYAVVTAYLKGSTLTLKELKGGRAVGIELNFMDVQYMRRFDALKRFEGGCLKSNLITRFILGMDQHGEHILTEKQVSGVKLIPDSLRKLNASQQRAVCLAMLSPFTLIQGPPGTGKTYTLVELVRNLRVLDPNAKILCCAPSNEPADHLAVQLARAGVNVTRIHSLRIDISYLSKEVQELTICRKLEARLGKKFKYNPEMFAAIDKETYDIIDESEVVVTTCNTAACRDLKDWTFPFVIIDEATQSSEPDAIIPATKGCVKLVMIGDENQLGVYNAFRELRNTNGTLSMFERMIIQLEQAPCVMLDTQYRMHPDICKAPSEVIYDGLLNTDPAIAQLRQSDALKFLHPTPNDYRQVLMINTVELHEQASDGLSFLNVREATIVTLCLTNLLHRCQIQPEDIGVITFYNGQKYHLLDHIDQHSCIVRSIKDRIMVDSVDAFQGREKDYIILSCVRSGNADSTSVGFLADKRRLNVALTRAKKGVIIVGNLSLLEKDDTWREFLTFYPKGDEKQALVALGVRNMKEMDCEFCDQRHGLHQPAFPVVQVLAASMQKLAVTENQLPGVDILVKDTSTLSNEAFHQVMMEHVMRRSKMSRKGYPIMKQRSGEFSSVRLPLYQGKSSKIKDCDMSSNLTRNCDRCRLSYKVDAQCNYMKEEECFYHCDEYLEEGSEKKKAKRGRQPAVHTCCNGLLNSRGCTSAPGHVSRTFTSMDDFVSTKCGRANLGNAIKWNVLAIDCEMLYTRSGYEVGRVTLVDRNLKCIYDRFILPKTPVIDYNTRFSGLKKEYFSAGPMVKTLDDVQKELLFKFIHPDTILIGHSLAEDLLRLKIIHELVVDTSVVFGSGKNTPGLKSLVKEHLKLDIQTGTNGHDSFEDAEACMKLVLLKLGKDHYL